MSGARKIRARSYFTSGFMCDMGGNAIIYVWRERYAPVRSEGINLAMRRIAVCDAGRHRQADAMNLAKCEL
ncbi:MAG: hypothetical protein WBC70_13420 [Candidatus Aminicenantales bacterium]